MLFFPSWLRETNIRFFVSRPLPPVESSLNNPSQVKSALTATSRPPDQPPLNRLENGAVGVTAPLSLGSRHGVGGADR